MLEENHKLYNSHHNEQEKIVSLISKTKQKSGKMAAVVQNIQTKNYKRNWQKCIFINNKNAHGVNINS